MNKVSETRFNAIAGYARSPLTRVIFEELEYFEVGDGDIIGMVVKDLTDGDFFGFVFAKDQNFRFRNVDITQSCSSCNDAKSSLRCRLEHAASLPPSDHFQGDEEAGAVDFFAPVRDTNLLHPSFLEISNQKGYLAARRIIELMMRWHDDLDGNFVEQFQTTGFDQRIWELYLYAMLIEARYEISKEHVAPDFCCSGLDGEFCIEAVTVGVSQENTEIVDALSLDTQEQKEEYLREYMPIRFGKALIKKRKKKHKGQKYWELDHVKGKPFALAVADFSSKLSMTMSRSALELYLFGYRHSAGRNEDGTLNIVTERVQRHRWKNKTLPSGFFRQDESRGISAVIFNSSGTVAKFNRMGVASGFGEKDVLLIREGTMANNDPNASVPKFFRVIVNADGYSESWVEGLDVYHNPNADIPFRPDFLPNATHHFLRDDGQVETVTNATFHPLASVTKHIVGIDVAKQLEELGDKTHYVFTVREDEFDKSNDIPPSE